MEPHYTTLLSGNPSMNIESQALIGLYFNHKEEEKSKILPPSQKPLYIDVAPNHPGAGYQANMTPTRSYSNITKDLYSPSTTFSSSILSPRPVVNYTLPKEREYQSISTSTYR